MYGGSSRVPGLNASLAATADRLAKIMDALGLKRADIVAYSRGRAVALLFAASRDHVRGGYSCASESMLHSGRSAAALLQHADWSVFREDDSVPSARRWKAIALKRMHGDQQRVLVHALAGHLDGLEVPGTISHLMQIWRVGGWILRCCARILERCRRCRCS